MAHSSEAKYTKMTEQEIILQTTRPGTRSSLTQQLSDGGVHSGSTLIVHASLRSLGWIAGGSVTVIHALLDCLGRDGTLVMPAHTAHLSDPARWRAPPVPDEWVDILRSEMPPYDPLTTPTRGMGATAELFRTWPGAKRSSHPTCSLAAFGRLAAEITADHPLESPLGEGSPSSKLYAEDAQILLLGVDFNVCTLLHLAEQRAWPGRPLEPQASPVLENGVRHWTLYEAAPVMDTEHFIPIGQSLIKEGFAKTFMVGIARSVLVSSRAAVDYAVRVWSSRQPPQARHTT